MPPTVCVLCGGGVSRAGTGMAVSPKNSQYLAAGGQNAQARTGHKQAGAKLGAALQQVLAVVQYKQARSRRQPERDRLDGGRVLLFGDAQDLRDHGRDVQGLAHRGKLDIPDGIEITAARIHGDPRLADAAGPG